MHLGMTQFTLVAIMWQKGRKKTEKLKLVFSFSLVIYFDFSEMNTSDKKFN